MRRALFSAVGCAGFLMCAAAQAASPFAYPVSDLEKDLLKSVHEHSYGSTRLEHCAETWSFQKPHEDEVVRIPKIDCGGPNQMHSISLDEISIARDYQINPLIEAQNLNDVAVSIDEEDAWWVLSLTRPSARAEGKVRLSCTPLEPGVLQDVIVPLKK